MIVWMADAKGAVNFVNRKWLTFTGRRLRDELGNGWTASVHPDDLESLLDAYGRAIVDHAHVLVELVRFVIDRL